VRLTASIIRLNNYLNLFSSYLFSLLLHKPIHWGNPAFISIEPTNHCNLHCPECPTGQSGLTRAAGILQQKDFERIIDQLTPYLTHLTLYFQGEPYLNKNIFDLIANARSKRIYVWSSTNGHFLTDSNIMKTIESGLDKLVISLDGTDQQTYEKYRIGGSFDTVAEGIRKFVQIRKQMGVRHPRLEIQLLVLKSNEHQLREIKRLGRSFGVDKTVLKTAQFYDFEKGNPLMPGEGKWSRYKRTSGQADERTSNQIIHQYTTASEHHGTTTPRHHGTMAPRHKSPVTNCQSPVTSHQSPVTNLYYAIKNPQHNRCFRMWAGCVITWDGKVVPCCYDKDADHCMGDLSRQSFDEIWKGEKYRRFRQTILRNRKSVDICRNCTQKW